MILEQIVDQPTRDTLNTFTLLDPILVSDRDFVTQSGIIPVYTLSDHALVYSTISRNEVKNNYYKKTSGNVRNV